MVEPTEDIAKCADCGKYFNMDELESVEGGEHYCYDCLSYELDLGVSE